MGSCRRLAHQTDANQQDIIDSLLKAGATVADLSRVGSGCPDILVGFRGQNYLFEIKQPQHRLSPAQEKWIRQWNGRKPVKITNVYQALLVIGLITAEQYRKLWQGAAAAGVKLYSKEADADSKGPLV